MSDTGFLATAHNDWTFYALRYSLTLKKVSFACSSHAKYGIHDTYPDHKGFILQEIWLKLFYESIRLLDISNPAREIDWETTTY